MPLSDGYQTEIDKANKVQGTGSHFNPGSSVGYNGNTGAQARWDVGEQMWIDSSGERIRDDAILATPPAGKTPPPTAAPTSAPAPTDPAAPITADSPMVPPTGPGVGWAAMTETQGSGKLGVSSARPSTSILASLGRSPY